MSLDELTGDDKSESSSKRKYVQPTKEEFEACIDQTQGEWVIDPDAPGAEYVYENHDIFPEHLGIVLRTYSTIDERTDKARDKGEDAIRLLIYNRNVHRPMGGRKKTLRIESWCKNFKEKVHSLFEESKEYVQRCEECDGWMVVRDGQYGEFLGCSNYPDCDHTEQIDALD